MVDDEADALARRCARALARPGAWIECSGGGYLLRAGTDRRRRATMGFDEEVFRLLTQEPGLKQRPGGGFVACAMAAPMQEAPQPGRPGTIEGHGPVAGPDGVVRQRRANLGESPLAWLARRRDADGSPLLTPREAAAGEKLREDFHKAGQIGRLTMDWSAAVQGPKAGGANRLDPAERNLQAKARVRAALKAVGPGLDGMLERVCIAGTTLEVAEADLHLPRRSGKTVLKLALQRLAAHYRI